MPTPAPESEPLPVSDGGSFPPLVEGRGRTASGGIALCPRRVALILGLIAFGLTLGNPLAKYSEFLLGPDGRPGLREIIWRFEFDCANSIEIWYSATLLLGAAALLAIIARVEWHEGRRYASLWGLLSVGFVCLSLDETIKLHKILIFPLCRGVVGASFPCYSWVVPGGLFVLVLAAVCWRLLASLDRSTRRCFLGSAAVYLTGALGVEALSGLYANWYGIESVRYVLASTLEEALEMTGMILFLYALLEYMAQEFGTLEFCVSPRLKTETDV